MSSVQQELWEKEERKRFPHRKDLSREHYTNWGGWFPEINEDRDLLQRLPPWRQEEILGTARAVREHPEAVAYETHTVNGGPIPGQVLLSSFISKAHQPVAVAAVSLVDRPSITDPQLLRIVSYIPDSIPLASIQAQAVGKSMSERIYDLSQEQFTVVLDALKKHVTPATVLQNCTPRGKGGYIKHSKPTDGVFAYIWRMARLFNGEDVHMPVTADWDLSDGIAALTGLRIGFYPSNDFKKAIMNHLEAYSDLLVLCVGGNPSRGSLAWGRAMGWNSCSKFDKVALGLGVTADELTAIVARLKAVGAGQ